MTDPSLDAKPVTCANCGSDRVVYEGPAEGYWCKACGASDSDE